MSDFEVCEHNSNMEYLSIFNFYKYQLEKII